MLKKVCAVLLILVVVVGLCACDNETKEIFGIWEGTFSSGTKFYVAINSDGTGEIKADMVDSVGVVEFTWERQGNTIVANDGEGSFEITINETTPITLSMSLSKEPLVKVYE